MSVLLLKTPSVIQTLGPVEIDPYWLRRGLQMVVDNGRVVFNREVQKLQPTTVTGGPKSQVSKFGRAMGFGPTYGLGTTDALAGSTLAPPTTSKRSIVAELYPKTSGGGTLGRVFQDASGTGLARGEAFYMNAATGIVYAIFITGAATAAQWAPSAPLTVDTWSIVGFSTEFIASTVTPGYAYINGKLVVSANNIAVAGTLPGTNPTTDLVLGNRASDSLRGWDGMQGLILIFDGFLEAKDHARLAMNRRQVFLESRAIWVPATSGATSHATSGALVGQGATVAGTAAHIAKHATSGVLTGQGSTVAGTAARTRAHPSSGVLAGQGAVIAGTAARTSPGVHATSGALTGQGAVVVGTAAHIAKHATSGTLVGPGATVAGTAARVAAAVTHGTSGALVGQGAVIVATARNGTVSAVGGYDDKKKKLRKQIIKEIARLNELAIETVKAESSPAIPVDTPVTKTTAKAKVKGQVKEQIYYDDEDEVLMLLLA